MNTPYVYSTNASDPDQDSIRYGWDWNNDGTVDEWTMYHQSDIYVDISHTWTSYGTKTIKVQAEDNVGDKSNFSSELIIQVLAPPQICCEYPEDESLLVNRPPLELNATIADPEGDTLNIWFYWRNHQGQWKTLVNYPGVNNGTYQYTPIGNDWIWGDTTYFWSVNITDGSYWFNSTFSYSTDGSRYDVNNDDGVDFIDAGLVWTHRTTLAVYDGLFDVNNDDEVNFIDAGITWANRD
jgi:hypothetical protein